MVPPTRHHSHIGAATRTAAAEQFSPASSTATTVVAAAPGGRSAAPLHLGLDRAEKQGYDYDWPVYDRAGGRAAHSRQQDERHQYHSQTTTATATTRSSKKRNRESRRARKRERRRRALLKSAKTAPPLLSDTAVQVIGHNADSQAFYCRLPRHMPAEKAILLEPGLHVVGQLHVGRGGGGGGAGRRSSHLQAMTGGGNSAAMPWTLGDAEAARRAWLGVHHATSTSRLDGNSYPAAAAAAAASGGGAFAHDAPLPRRYNERRPSIATSSDDDDGNTPLATLSPFTKAALLTQHTMFPQKATVHHDRDFAPKVVEDAHFGSDNAQRPEIKRDGFGRVYDDVFDAYVDEDVLLHKHTKGGVDADGTDAAGGVSSMLERLQQEVALGAATTC